MKYYVIKIHNNSVSSLDEADSEQDAKDMVRDMFFHQFGHAMDDEQLDDLEDKFEVYVDEDCDNQYTFSVNMIDY